MKIFGVRNDEVRREIKGRRDYKKFKTVIKKVAEASYLRYFFYPATHIYRANIQWALMAATSPPQKCAMMALGVRSR